MNNETDVSIKFKNSVTGEKKLEQYAETLSKIKSVLGSIDKGAAQQIESSAKSTKEIDGEMKKMTQNFNTAFNYTALRTFARGLSKVVEGFTSMTAKSTAFLEDFNLFQVAFRGNYTEATKFVNKLSEMYGLDEDWLVRTTAQFKQLSNAMGLANETGEKVSKLMTEMAIDISSLYNIDVDRASSVLQSALAGQTKPIRGLGGDITQASLQKTLDTLDISGQVADLSYAEKRLLIIVSLTQQLSGVTNDWGRTLESPSNQIRIMNEQWQRLQRNVGNVFIAVVGKVLPYLNAVLMVLNEIAKIIAGLFGYKLGDFDYFDEDTIGGVEDFGGALDSAADSAKKLKQGLRGFDKLNVITTPSSGGSGAGGGGVGGVNPKLLSAFNDAFDLYQSKLKDVEMKATKIRDKIMEWLGFTKQIDKETGEVSFKFSHITGGTILGALAVGGSIYQGINFIFKILKRIGLIKFGSFKELIELFKNGTVAKNIAKFTTGFESLASTLGLSTSALAGIAAAIIAIGAALVYAYNHNEDFKKSVDDMVKNVIDMFKVLYEAIEPIMQSIYELIVPVWNTIKDTVVLAVQVIYDTIVVIFKNIADFISGTAQIVTDIINGDYAKAFDDFVEMVKKIWENWQDYFNKIGEHFKEWVGKVLQNVVDFVIKAIDKFNDLLKWLGELPGKFLYFIGVAIGKLVKAITETNWLELGGRILTGIVNGLINLIVIGNKAIEWARETFNKIVNAIANINWGKLGKSILDGIVNGMFNFGKTLKKWADSFVQGIKDGLGIHSPAQLIIDAKIGDYSMDAIAVGMEREMPILKEQAQDIVDTLNSGVKEVGIDTNFSYDMPQFNANSILSGLQNSGATNDNSFKTSVNPTIIVQVGDKEIAKRVLTNLQDMAKDNGKPITIGG